MNSKDLIILLVIFLAMFTLFKIDASKECNSKSTFKRNTDQVLIFETHD